MIEEPAIVDGCSSTGCFAMPTGFSLVAFGGGATNAACPSGFAQPIDYVEGPTASAAACACSTCQVTAPPSCASGALQNSFDTDGSGTCGTPGGAPYSNNPAGTCLTDGYSGPISATTDMQAVAPPPTGGTCSIAPAKNPNGISYASRDRVCHPSTLAQCAGLVCPPTLAGAFKTCIASAGDVACPSAFPTKHLIGTDVNFACTGGTCACTVGATCSGVVTLYKTSTCSGGALPVVVDGACHNVNGGGTDYHSYKYVGTAANVACTGSGAPPAASGLALVGATTTCCTP